MSKRKPLVQKFTVANGQTAGVSNTGQPLDVSSFAFGGIHVSEGLNGKTLSFTDHGEWGADVILNKSVVTGWNPFTDSEARSIGPSMALSVSVNSAPTQDSSIWLKLKS